MNTLLLTDTDTLTKMLEESLSAYSKLNSEMAEKKKIILALQKLIELRKLKPRFNQFADWA